MMGSPLPFLSTWPLALVAMLKGKAVPLHAMEALGGEEV
jgi:hypothetical protein